jgi:uncharacterized membrane protein
MKSQSSSSEHSPVQSSVNIPLTERNISMLGGALLVVAGMARRGWLGSSMSALGASMIFQGGTGMSPIYKLLGTNRAVNNQSANVSVPHQQGRHVSTSITINRPVEEVYSFWRDFTNLPRFMPYLESVEILSPTRSHWSVKGPAGRVIGWDAEIINEERNVVIGWRSLENPYINHAGAARFSPAPGDRGTEVRVEMEYLPVGGALAVAIANILGMAPEQQLTESLQRLKQLLEVGEIVKNEKTTDSHQTQLGD